MNIFKAIRNRIRGLQKNSLILGELKCSGNSVTYQYQVKGEWKQYFNNKEKFTVDYGVDVSAVPKGVLVIPFLANVLPISWVCDAEIIVEEIERDFHDSIENFKKGYVEMYPMISFKGKLTTKTISSYEPAPQMTSALFFSAGVDSFDTFLSHMDEKPLLITLWGSDVTFEDAVGWRSMLQRINYMKDSFGLESVVVKTNFRRFLREGALGRLVKISGDGWWHGFQHGIGILCHAAPYAYLRGFKKLYIASSFTEKQKGKVVCASDPTIDEAVKFLGTHVIHDGYEFDRLCKVSHIVDYARQTNNYLPLHVCWEESGGENCSHCEKCSRTILEIYACGEDPEKFGFNPSLISESAVAKRKSDLTRWEFNYIPVIKALKQRYSEATIAEWAKWIFKY